MYSMCLAPSCAQIIYLIKSDKLKKTILVYVHSFQILDLDFKASGFDMQNIKNTF